MSDSQYNMHPDEEQPNNSNNNVNNNVNNTMLTAHSIDH